MEEKNINLRRALAKCLERLHDYFGLTEAQMKAAIDDAEVNPGWSWTDDKKWTDTAYTKTDAVR